MTFAERLKALREKAGLTQAELADAAEMPIGTLRDYEQGKRRHNPTLAASIKLARALGTTCEAFSECEDLLDANGRTNPGQADKKAAKSKAKPGKRKGK